MKFFRAWIVFLVWLTATAPWCAAQLVEAPFQLSLTLSQEFKSRPAFWLSIREGDAGQAVISWSGGGGAAGQTTLTAEQLSKLKADIEQLNSLGSATPDETEIIFSYVTIRSKGRRQTIEEASGEVARWCAANSVIGPYVRPGILFVRHLPAPKL